MTLATGKTLGSVKLSLKRTGSIVMFTSVLWGGLGYLVMPNSVMEKDGYRNVNAQAISPIVSPQSAFEINSEGSANIVKSIDPTIRREDEQHEYAAKADRN